MVRNSARQQSAQALQRVESITVVDRYSATIRMSLILIDELERPATANLCAVLFGCDLSGLEYLAPPTFQTRSVCNA